MCGRVNIIDAPIYAFFARFLNLPLQIETALNIGPTERVWALKQNGGVFEALPMRWWLIPNWSNGPQSKFSMFNARAETLHASKAYSVPFKRQRCAIPVASYLEWRGTKQERQPFSIEREDGEALVLGGLWDSWEGPDGLIQSCTIVTTAAPSALETYHHRSPLMLNGDALLTWLDGSSQMKELEGLLEPSVPFSLRIQDVDRAVNQVRRKDQAAQRPIGPSTTIAPDVGADDWGFDR